MKPRSSQELSAGTWRARERTRKPVLECSDPTGHRWRVSARQASPKGTLVKENCTRCHAGRTALID